MESIMPVSDYVNLMLIIAAFSGLLAIYFFLALLFKIKKLKLIATCKNLLGMAVFSLLCLSISFLFIGLQGYSGLTQEVQVGEILVTPTGDQTYHARLKLSNGREQVFALKGDELVVEAYILKWKSWANILGLETAYRLERVSGRYRDIVDEKNKTRTVYAIDSRAGKGIAEWRENYDTLSILLDVEHGSASFVSADEAKKFRVMVTNSGLLIRPMEDIPS